MTVLILLGDTRDPDREVRSFEFALGSLYTAGRIDDYRTALVEVWSCIPYSLAGQTSRTVDAAISAGAVILVLEELVRRVIAAEVGRDLLSNDAYDSLTRAWRWSRLWGDDPCRHTD